MARIQKFEDLEAWKKAREMTKAIYLVTSTGEFFKDLGLRDQVRRAGVSAMSDIAEGFEGGIENTGNFLHWPRGRLEKSKPNFTPLWMRVFFPK